MTRADDDTGTAPSDLWGGPETGAVRAQRPGEASPPAQTPSVGSVRGSSLPRRGRGRATGSVADIRQRFETHRRLPTTQIINFRLERYDARGGRLQPVPVEMRGITITGNLTNGERVRVEGRFHNGTMYSSKVVDLSTGGTLSTQVGGRFGRRFGRRTESLVLLGIVLLLVAAVRFIPAVYINTPFGLHEYENEVNATCGQIAALSNRTPPLDFDDQGRVSRQTVLTAFDATAAAIVSDYQLLLSHNTPYIRSSRRDRVAALLPSLEGFYAEYRTALASLAPEITVPELDETATAEQGRVAGVASQLSDAMTQLSGGQCHDK